MSRPGLRRHLDHEPAQLQGDRPQTFNIRRRVRALARGGLGHGGLLSGIVVTRLDATYPAGALFQLR
jgi:hypothetical protein